jgi:glycine dehydrogenase subunit 2
VKTSPHTTRVQRMDETTAARKPVLRWKAPAAKDEVEVDSAAKEW